MYRTIAILLGAIAILWGAVEWREQRMDGEVAARLAEQLPPLPAVGPEWPGAFERRLVSVTRRAVEGPDRSAALDDLSALYHSNGFTQEAIGTYRAWLDLAPRNPRAAYRLAVILSGYGQAEEALPLLDITMEEAPDYRLAAVRKGEILLKSNRTEEALALFDSVRERHPDEVAASMGMARGLIQRERWEEARSVLVDLTQRFPHYGPAWSARATVHDRLGEPEAVAEARSMGEQNLERGMLPDPWIDETYEHCYDVYRLRVASFAYMPTDIRQREFAIRLMRRALSLKPDDLETLQQLATYYYQLERLEDARQTLERILRVAQDDPQSWINMISFLEDTGGHRSSRRLLAEARSRFPENPRLWFLEGTQRARMGRFEAALDAFRQAEAHSPRWVLAIIEQGRCLAALGRHREALDLAQRALELDPGQPMAAAMLVEWWIDLGDIERAREAYVQAAGLERLMPQRLEHLNRRFTEAFGIAPPETPAPAS